MARFWRELFVDKGYELFDFVRPQVICNTSIESRYCHNVLFFAHQSIVASLPPKIIVSRLSSSAEIPDYAPLAYRLRKMVLRLLPSSMVSRLAVMKHKRAVRSLA